MAAGLADSLIAKCREDVPILLAAPQDMVNIYAYDADLDKKVIQFDVAGEMLNVDGQQFWVRPEGPLVPTTVSLVDQISEAKSKVLHTLIHETQPSPGYW